MIWCSIQSSPGSLRTTRQKWDHTHFCLSLGLLGFALHLIDSSRSMIDPRSLESCNISWPVEANGGADGEKETDVHGQICRGGEKWGRRYLSNFFSFILQLCGCLFEGTHVNLQETCQNGVTTAPTTHRPSSSPPSSSGWSPFHTPSRHCRWGNQDPKELMTTGVTLKANTALKTSWSEGLLKFRVVSSTWLQLCFKHEICDLKSGSGRIFST